MSRAELGWLCAGSSTGCSLCSLAVDVVRRYNDEAVRIYSMSVERTAGEEAAYLLKAAFSGTTHSIPPDTHEQQRGVKEARQ
jgi:hypothetical protein